MFLSGVNGFSVKEKNLVRKLISKSSGNLDASKNFFIMLHEKNLVSLVFQYDKKIVSKVSGINPQKSL